MLCCTEEVRNAFGILFSLPSVCCDLQLLKSTVVFLVVISLEVSEQLLHGTNCLAQLDGGLKNRLDKTRCLHGTMIDPIISWIALPYPKIDEQYPGANQGIFCHKNSVQCSAPSKYSHPLAAAQFKAVRDGRRAFSNVMERTPVEFPCLIPVYFSSILSCLRKKCREFSFLIVQTFE